MALVVNGHCIKCGKPFQRTIGSGKAIPSICSDCDSEAKHLERRLYFKGLDGLSIEERIRKIEEWIYKYRAPSERKY